MELWAHSKNSSGHPHLLAEHLEQAGRLAADFASAFEAEDWGHCVGRLHDVGKRTQVFQDYLRGMRSRGGDHVRVGAMAAFKIHPLLAVPLAGHHGGLPETQKFLTNLERQVGECEIPDIEVTPPPPSGFPRKIADCQQGGQQGRVNAAFMRMLFSVLVDADYLDTAAHFGSHVADPERYGSSLGIEGLWRLFRDDQTALMQQAEESSLNRLRRDIYEHCIQQAKKAPGFFTLTVPTGGGKTRTGLGFALKHALIHGHNRIVVVVPYTSIIEQTADVYRSIFSDLDIPVVLEHHSQVCPDTLDDAERQWWELKSENWDAPIVVTTAVQFFESLFSNRPAKCRKLHRIARSVIILDEIHTLPTHLLRPARNMLQELVERYFASVVLTSATQPPLAEGTHSLQALPRVRELAPEVDKLFRQLSRVNYTLSERGCSWPEIAGKMTDERQTMTVVNTRGDALNLWQCLSSTEGAFYLSSNLCGAHRRQRIKTISDKLGEGAPVRLVTTQVVECGVDIDFPVVRRAWAGLERIVQAAGRCNREGNLANGEVEVFEPADGSLPPGVYRTAHDKAKEILVKLASDVNMDDPQLYKEYFTELYATVPLDKHDIATREGRGDYPTVDKHFRLIRDETVPVLVPFGSGGQYIKGLAEGSLEPEALSLRRVQPYLVNVYENEFQTLQQEGVVKELAEGLWGLTDAEMYNESIGLRHSK